MIKPTLLALPALLAVMAHPTTAFRPIGAIGQSAVLINGVIYLHGGLGMTNTQSNLYTLDVTMSWTTSSPLWTDRTYDAGVFTVPSVYKNVMWPSPDGSSFYIWGGASTSVLAQGGFAQYKIATESWSTPPATGSMPQQRYQSSVTWTSSGKTYIWGGYANKFTG
ncbi:hypothetical protein BC938DRAFT_475199 [Jimgerdemannia flammicorona]|uniref:Galactose oxidase n=1 Tax=Jimgerdemannia flammicorona TaxID=994334 RepID=A0A433PZ30_9FUNG|nr:hypothetical protein BC938DRAFT_475199 [Jimgerdemannia flammicorona]